MRFPFLFGGTFIEAGAFTVAHVFYAVDFPSFSEGLSLRPTQHAVLPESAPHFPSFSEGLSLRRRTTIRFLFLPPDFPSFSEGLSLRLTNEQAGVIATAIISLPFRRDFH